MTGAEPVLRVEGLSVDFGRSAGLLRRRGSVVSAVDGVSFELSAGETLALVGESGSGKSTIARALVGLVKPSAGRIFFDGVDVTRLNKRALRRVRREIQILFQDPFASLDPHLRVKDIIEEPLLIHRRKPTRATVPELLDMVGLDASNADRYPHELSGGQRQRVGIARALVLRPSVLVLDEPVSALDVSVQAQVVNLLIDLQRRLGLAYLFIAHDLSVVRAISDRVMVMYLGRIAEAGPAVFERPAHPYTQALLSAVPTPDPRVRDEDRQIRLEGDIPSPANPPSGCRFRTRCPKATERCAAETPELIEREVTANVVACHYAAVLDDPSAAGLAPLADSRGGANK